MPAPPRRRTLPNLELTRAECQPDRRQFHQGLVRGSPAARVTVAQYTLEATLGATVRTPPSMSATRMPLEWGVCATVGPMWQSSEQLETSCPGCCHPCGRRPT